MSDMSHIILRDLRVQTPEGGLQVRRWQHRDGRAQARAPIVLLHDSLGCIAVWRDFPERLAVATGREIIAYDRLGFGQSDPHPHRLSGDFIHAEARDGFGHVRAALSLDAFIAFGHSVGGGMAVACAAQYPDACRALITVSAQAFVEDRTLAGIRAAQKAYAQPALRERLARYHGDKTGWVLSAWIDSWLAPAFADWCLDDDLRGVMCPVLAIHGALDEFGSAAHPARIADLSKGPATVQLMEGTGHMPHREQPERTMTLISQWFAELAPDRA